MEALGSATALLTALFQALLFLLSITAPSALFLSSHSSALFLSSYSCFFLVLSHSPALFLSSPYDVSFSLPFLCHFVSLSLRSCPYFPLYFTLTNASIIS